MAEFSEGYWQSADGLKLHYRDYAGPAERVPLLCLPGLTRNSRDFQPLADRLAGRYRLICPSFRGRAESAPAKDPATYVPMTYVGDVLALLDALSLDRVAIVGTSLGGIVAMLLAAVAGDRVAAVLLNDIGPVIEQAGLDRIRSYLGGGGSQPTWVHAARALSRLHRSQYPDYKLQDWLAMAKRLSRLNSTGRIVAAYDARIAEPFKAAAETNVDMWPLLDGLKGKPVLIVHGALSDILSAGTAAEMIDRLGPSADLATLPRIGHTPVLDEPIATEAIDRWLARVK